MRVAIVTLTLLLLPSLALGQKKEDDPDKVSNDNPARPLQMPPASTETKEAFDDFERFQRRGAWDRALKSLYTISDDQALRFVDGQNGFIIPVARKRRSVMTALPPAGRAAYRLFYDAEAKKLYDEAEGASELKNLERLYSAYFITSIGDNAADRLGDLYFEQGRFDRAADCWLSVLRELNDTDLSPGLLTVKAALALHRAGRHREYEQLHAELADRYGEDKLTIGGETGTAAQLLDRLIGEGKAAKGPDEPSALQADLAPALTATVEPAWQLRFAESIEAGMSPVELTQWESNALSSVVPAVVNGESTLFANYLGHIFAVDLKTGKLLWRSASFHNLELFAMQPAARMVDHSRYAIVTSGDFVWTVLRDMKDQNFQAPFQLVCRRAAGGEIVWNSGDLSDYAQIDLVGPPLLADGKVFIAGKTLANPQQRQTPPHYLVLAIRPDDGKILWKTEVASSRQAQQMYFYYYRPDSTPQPRLLYRSGSVYVDTHLGVLGRLDAESGALEWGFGYKTDASQSQSNFFYYYQPQEPKAASTPPLQAGDTFLVKGVESGRLEAIDPNQMKVLWDRPITKASRLLGADERTVFLGGAELSAVDIRTRELKWATRVPGGSMESRVLVRPEAIWQLTSRGIFEVDPKTGAVRRIFRGNDLGSIGGDLYLTDQFLLAVSNRTISAYPRREGAAPAPGSARPSTDAGLSPPAGVARLGNSHPQEKASR